MVRVWTLASGMILIFVGLLLLSLANITVYGKPIVVNYAGGSESESWARPKSWQISANFTAGDYIIVYFIPDSRWQEIGFDTNDYFESFQTLFIDIIPPKGNETSFAVMLQYDPVKQFYGIRVKAVIKVGEGLTVINSSRGQEPAWIIQQYFSGEGSAPVEEIGGIAQDNGNYTAVLSGPFGGPTAIEPQPPVYLSISKRALEHPYAYFIFIGAPVTVSGVTLIIWSRKRKGRFKRP